MLQLPRASWNNLQASSPVIVMGLTAGANVANLFTLNTVNDGGSGGTSIAAGLYLYRSDGNYDKAYTIGRADNAAGNGVQAVAPVAYDGANYQRLRTQPGGLATAGVQVLGAGPLLWDETSATLAARMSRYNPAATTADNVTGAVCAGMLIFDSSGTRQYCSNMTAGDGVSGTRILAVSGYLWDGGTFGRARVIGAAEGSNGTGVQAVVAMVGTGSIFLKRANNGAANMTATTQIQAAMSAAPGEWFTADYEAAAQVTCTKAAGAAGVRHICRSVSMTLAGALSGIVRFNLRDGATGAGTIMRSWALAILAGDSKSVEVSGLNIFGTAATAMTLESAAALPALTEGSVGMSGYSTV